MKQRWSVMLALLAVAGGACRAGAPAARVEEPKATPVARPEAASEPRGPLLWRVEGKTGPIWMYGTLHLSTEDAVPQIAWEKLATAKTFVMEADISSLNPFALMKRAQLPEGQALDAMLGPERWQKMVEKTGGKMPEAALKRFKPWFATMVVMMGMLTGTFQMDLEMSRRARDAGAKLVYLESAEEQLALLEKSTDLEDLTELLDKYDEAKADLDELVVAYKAGDAAAIEKAMSSKEWDDPGENEALLKDRNEKWLPTIEKLIREDGDVFIAVGAAHLIGEHGVPTLLRKRGHKVERWVADPTPR